jgi:hypothetical protein
MPGNLQTNGCSSLPTRTVLNSLTLIPSLISFFVPCSFTFRIYERLKMLLIKISFNIHSVGKDIFPISLPHSQEPGTGTDPQPVDFHPLTPCYFQIYLRLHLLSFLLPSGFRTKILCFSSSHLYYMTRKIIFLDLITLIIFSTLRIQIMSLLLYYSFILLLFALSLRSILFSPILNLHSFLE